MNKYAVLYFIEFVLFVTNIVIFIAINLVYLPKIQIYFSRNIDTAFFWFAFGFLNLSSSHLLSWQYNRSGEVFSFIPKLMTPLRVRILGLFFIFVAWIIY